MRILGIIPARGGSKGIPGKNIKLLNGQPLIAYTIQQALKAEKLAKVIVSTDDAAIAAVSEKFGAVVPFLRPSHLASDSAKSVDVVLHALDFLQNEQHEKYDAICLLQPTSPYRPKGCIDSAIEAYIASKCDSLVSVRKIPDHYNPYWAFEKDEAGNLVRVIREKALITSRQNLPACFHRDGAIYIASTDFIRSNKTLLSDFTSAFQIDSPVLINIDTLEDWKLAEEILFNEY